MDTLLQKIDFLLKITRSFSKSGHTSTTTEHFVSQINVQKSKILVAIGVCAAMNAFGL